MSFISDFKLSSFQYVAVSLREIALDHSEPRCVLRIFLRGAYRDYTCVGLQSIHSR